MLTIFEGQISFSGGLQEALETVTSHKNVQNGVLRITSDQGSGMIGIFCGRYMTGGVLTLSGERKLPAIKRLLSCKEGSFAFLDVLGEKMPDLKQGLCIDIRMLLDAVPDLAKVAIPLSEESLTRLTAPAEDIHLIDTAFINEEEPAFPDEDARIAEITRTYNRLVALSEYERLHRTEDDAKFEEEERQYFASYANYQATQSPVLTAEDQRQLLGEAPAVVPELPEPQQPIDPTARAASVTRSRYTKLCEWEEKSQRYLGLALWGAFALIGAITILIYWRDILGSIQAAFPK